MGAYLWFQQSLNPDMEPEPSGTKVLSCETIYQLQSWTQTLSLPRGDFKPSFLKKPNVKMPKGLHPA